jgi:hypothetical protein
MKRRNFIKTAAGVGALSGLGDLGFLSQLQPVSAAEAKLKPDMVRLHPEIEPLVRLLEDTPRERVLEEVASRIKHGTTYREVLAALLLAGVRNIQPRPVGFKFHAVLVVNSAHLASLASPDTDRWLPIFWAIDTFKKSQADDVSQGDWTMGPVEESKVPPSHRAKQAFIEAMDNWDEAAADAAIVGLVRTAGAHEISRTAFARWKPSAGNTLSRYCARSLSPSLTVSVRRKIPRRPTCPPTARSGATWKTRSRFAPAGSTASRTPTRPGSCCKPSAPAPRWTRAS